MLYRCRLYLPTPELKDDLAESADVLDTSHDILFAGGTVIVTD